MLGGPADDAETHRLAEAAINAFDSGDRAKAQALARQVLIGSPSHSVARQILGASALDIGDAAAARQHLEAAERGKPNDPQILNLLGVALHRLKDWNGARRRFARAGELGLILGWRNLAGLESDVGDRRAAVAALERALKLAPGDAEIHALLAHTHERAHDIEPAKRHAQAALRASPANSVASVALARALVRERNFVTAEKAAAVVTNTATASLNDRAVAWGVIGDARDLAGDARGAFQAFTSANQLLLRQHAPFLSATHLLYHPEGVQRMMRFVEKTDFSAWEAPEETPSPAFLIGFPRSGTTLLDQILSSHSAIVCIEEKLHFSDALSTVLKGDDLSAAARLSADQISAVRRDYWRRVREEEGEPRPGALIVDKFPLNIIVLPLIRRIFPEARVLFAMRDPRDVVLSCYQQRFGMNAAMAQFLELRSAAAYYDLVMRHYELCRARLGLAIHQVRYEDVVGDLEGAARGLADFLGVAFEPAMLDFNATALKRDIRTPSARQVIQPLYKRSVGRWRRYEADLEPALPILSAWAARYGYDV